MNDLKFTSLSCLHFGLYRIVFEYASFRLVRDNTWVLSILSKTTPN